MGGGTSGLPRGDDVPEGFPADLAGRYQAPALVGQGGMGLVFSAHHAALDRPVAVKVLRSMDPDSRARERFEREARILAEHPHAALVPLLEADLRHDPPYLVLPWFEGGDLRARIAAHGAVPPGTTARIGARLARALAHLHSHGVLHRDVKPGNVLLDGLGDAFLADVGLGLVPGAARLTRTEMVVGTLRYLARELGEGRPHSPASDLFALGAVLVETALGELGGPPFADVTATQARLRRIADPALRDLLLALLASVPERRPDSAATVAGELDRIERSDYTSRLSGGGRRPAASPDVFDLPTQAPLRLASVAVGNGEATSGAAAPVVGRSPVPVVAALAVLALVAGLGSGLGSGGNPSGSGSSAAVPVLPPARTLEPGGPWLRPPLGASGSPAPWLRERAMARGRGGNPVRAGSLGDREGSPPTLFGPGEGRSCPVLSYRMLIIIDLLWWSFVGISFE